MKKITSLFKSSVWLVVVVAVFIAVIYYRAFLFTAEFNKPVDVAMNEASDSFGITIPAYQLSAHQKSLYEILFSKTDDNTVQQVAQVPQEEENQSESLVDLVINNKASVDEDVIQPISLQEQDVQMSEDSVSISSDIEKENDSYSMDEIISAVKQTVNETMQLFIEENEQEAKHVLVDEATILTAKELLFKARLAYWNRDFKAAEDSYVHLTEMVTDDPNVYGELGNLYFMQSKWKKASDAYYQAAIKLKNINQQYQALHLLRIIRGLDTETANKLQAELQQTS